MCCYYSIENTYINKKFSHRRNFGNKPIPFTQIIEPYLEAFEK
jgi:hypothetical protein